MKIRALIMMLALAASVSVQAQSTAALQFVAAISLPSVKGRIDHLSVDAEHHRVFLAALGNDSVEVVDAEHNRHQKSIAGFGEPQGLAYLPASNRLFVANGSADRLDLLDAESFSPLKRLDKLPDADNVRYDAAARQIVVGYGRGALRVVDADRAVSLADIPLSGHPESFQLEKDGTRIFVNVPDARQIAVVDRAKGRVVAKWSVPGARANFPMALDEIGRHLFVGARSPAVMLVYDIDSGKVVSEFPIGGDTDDVFFDQERKQLYVICGDGQVSIFHQEAAGRYVHQATVKTAPRARTGLFVPEEGRLYVAAPASPTTPARLLVFRVQ